MKKIVIALLIIESFLFSQSSYSEADNWGVGMVIRQANVPYSDPRVDHDVANYVDSAVPMFYYDSKYFFLDGIEGGVKFYESESWRLSLLSRLRFVDIPQVYQNDHQLDSFDVGLQLRYKLNRENSIDLEYLSDIQGSHYANISYKGRYDLNSFELEPYATTRIKSKKFNSTYYGLIENIHGGMDIASGLNVKYHVTSNFYLLAGAEIKLLDKNAREALVVSSNTEYSTYFGVGFLKDKTAKKGSQLSITPYIRVAHGYATHSDIDQILGGNMPKEPYGNTLTSIFYGHPLADKLFGINFQVYLTTGFVWHHSSAVQDNLREYIVAMKAYYTIPLPIRFRIGLAEGLSYINEISYIEKTDLEDDDYTPSKVLNYLDYSLDVNLGDLLFTESLERAWLGVNVHHRSGIFEYSSQFGRISGGSNYPSIYLQVDF